MEVAASLGGFLVVNGGFSLGSDLCAQWLEGKEEWDWERAALFTGTGIAFQGMTQFARHYAVDVMFPVGGELWIAAGKTAVNQLAFAPVLRAISMAGFRYIQTRDWEDVREKVKADFFEAQGVSYIFKPLSNFIAFAVFPSNLVGQSIVLRVLGSLNNVYYSYILNRETGSKKGDEKEPSPVLKKPHRHRTKLRNNPQKKTPSPCPSPAPIMELETFLNDRATILASSHKHRAMCREVEEPGVRREGSSFCAVPTPGFFVRQLVKKIPQEGESLLRRW